MNLQARIAELASQLDAKRAEIVELAEIDEPTEDQVTRSDELVAEFDALDAERNELIERAENLARVRDAVISTPASVERAFHAPQVMVKRDPWDDVNGALRNVDMEARNPELIARAVTGLTDTKVPGVSDADLAEAVRKVELIPGAAQHVLACGSPTYRSAFEEYISSGGRPNHTPEEAAALRASMSTTSGNGGYALPTLLDPTIIATGTATRNPIRQIARVETGTVETWNGVTAGLVTTAWKGEGSAFTDGSPTLTGPSVTAAALTGYVTGSYEIFQDTTLFAQLPAAIAEAMDYAEGTAFISGSGSTAPKGIVTAISATAGSTVTCTTRGAFTSASAVDLFALVNAVSPRFEDTCTFIANKATFNTIRQMSSTGGSGSLFWTDLNGASPNVAPLLGSPIKACSDMASATTSGTALIVLGDFSRYLIYDRIGVTVEVIQNVVDSSGVPTGQRGLVAYKRVGANCLDINAFRFLKT